MSRFLTLIRHGGSAQCTKRRRFLRGIDYEINIITHSWNSCLTSGKPPVMLDVSCIFFLMKYAMSVGCERCNSENVFIGLPAISLVIASWKRLQLQMQWLP